MNDSKRNANYIRQKWVIYLLHYNIDHIKLHLLEKESIAQDEENHSYDFAFGMNFSDAIEDERVKK